MARGNNEGIVNMSYVQNEPNVASQNGYNNGGAVISHDEIELQQIQEKLKASQSATTEKKGFLSRFFKKDNKKEKPKLVPLHKLFRFATKLDVLMMAIGTLGALCNGATTPLMILVFTSIIDSFSSFGKLCDTNVTVSANQTFVMPNLQDQMRMQAIYLVLIAIATMIFSYFQIAFWLMPAEKETHVIRSKLFSSILKQDIGWFDCYKSGELTTRLTDDINKIKDGIGDKFGSCIQYFATFLIGVIISFTKGWKLTLVILAISPLLFISAMLFTKLTGVLTSNELKSYAKAGAVAEEVFTAIRTVFAFNGQSKEMKRYEVRLDDAKKYGIKKGFINGAMMGFLWLCMNSAYALGFWYGWSLTINIDPATGQPEYSIGKILLIFFNIIIGIFSLGNAGPFIGTLANARAAAYEIFTIIDREPPIDSSNPNGLKPDRLVGDIEYKNIQFNYPARPKVQVLNGLNLKIRAGTTVALVGSSGCGKSTCIQLLQRFYDPREGSVTIDNINIKELNVNWLRTNLGVVNQEPILFGTSIYENIKFGRPSATNEEIIKAAKNANAHDFIMTLPQKYDTLVGDRGSQLSGGQKQRIAIARALVRDPKILLLDEATSALDNESEAIVQAALDRAQMGRTTIIVAHRLSTILNADVIYAFDKGKIAEFGTHEELMNLRGIYFNLVIAQQTAGHDQNKNKFQRMISNTDHEHEATQMFGKKKAEEAADTGDKDKKKKKKTKAEKKEEKKKEPSLMKVLALNKPEWYYIIIGCIASVFSGAVQPAFSIIFSKATATFSLCSIDEQREKITLYCILFIVFGVVCFISNILQNGMFGFSGENLTKRLRARGFETILKQEIGWFDDQKNNVGSLCTKLATEASAVQGATGVRLGFFFMNLSNFGLGLVLSFVFGWAIALVILAFVPLIVISGVLQTKMLTGFSSKDKKVLEEAGKITIEAISNIRTVAVLHKERYFIDLYEAKIKQPFKAALRSANLYGFMLGFSQSIIMYAVAAAYGLGAYLIQNQLFGMTFENIMLVFGCIVFGAQSVGQASTLMPDYTKAKVAIVNMFELFERVPKINNMDSTSGKTLNDQELSNGEIKLRQVEFTYPNRPETQILQKLDIKIKKGQRVALVGSSGCGKSTITQLIERFYDPDAGDITFCDRKLNELNLHWLRSQIGIVSQEPILFDLSIRENIAYGDNSREVSINQIMEAAKLANIHDFIMKLPHGYETNVGSKGTQLSGGQKQRISIARALVRNPKILLLDEATSALDTESEKIVQDALDKAQQGRTCIIIAHRLSTIRNADLIFVLQNGVVTEAGNHDQLIALNGFYAKLNGQHRPSEDQDQSVSL